MQLLEDILTSLALSTEDLPVTPLGAGGLWGGASFAFHSGVHVELIEILGD